MPIPASFTGRYLSWGATAPLLNPPIPDPGLLTKTGRALFVIPLILIGPCGTLYNLAQAARCKAITLLTKNANTKSTYSLLSLKHREMAWIDFKGLLAGTACPFRLLIGVVFVSHVLIATVCLTGTVAALVFGPIQIAPILLLGSIYCAVFVVSSYLMIKENPSPLHENFVQYPPSFKQHLLQETKWYYQGLFEEGLVISPSLTDAEIMEFDQRFEKANANLPNRQCLLAILNGVNILIDMGKVEPTIENVIQDNLKGRLHIKSVYAANPQLVRYRNEKLALGFIRSTF
jgi:hypothetical protein